MQHVLLRRFSFGNEVIVIYLLVPNALGSGYARLKSPINGSSSDLYSRWQQEVDLEHHVPWDPDRPRETFLKARQIPH